MNKGYAYTTVKKAYVVLNEYFRYLYREELIPKNPMANVEMMKKGNFLSAQDKENLPECETVTIFTPEEIEKFKAEAFSTFKDGKRKYQQAAAYILMLNTGLRTGELPLSPRQVADLLGHSTSQITELYYVKKDTARLGGLTEEFEM